MPPNGLFDEAERLADSDEIRFRVQVARLPIWYVKLATNRVTGDERADLLRKFLAVARKAGITHIANGNRWMIGRRRWGQSRSLRRLPQNLQEKRNEVMGNWQ
jgi:hypothetical protein